MSPTGHYTQNPRRLPDSSDPIRQHDVQGQVLAITGQATASSKWKGMPIAGRLSLWSNCEPPQPTKLLNAKPLRIWR